jgi:hypothetical protein
VKNLVILEGAEVESIFTDEGFTLVLANGQTITIRAEGAKMSQGEITVFAAHVRGESDTIRTVLDQFSAFLKSRNGEALPAPETVARSLPSNPGEKHATRKARKDGAIHCQICNEELATRYHISAHMRYRHPGVKRVDPKALASGVKCDYCGKPCRSQRGKTKHENVCDKKKAGN